MTIGSTLAVYFDGAAGKILSAVEAHPTRSNQHEFNGVGGLKELLDEPPAGGRIYSTTFVYLDDDMEPLAADGTLTWYDARASHPNRSECRLYYPPNVVLDAAAAGDYMVLAKPHDDVGTADLVVVISPGLSTVAAQLQHLFGLEPSARFDVETLPGDEQLNFASRQLLQALGFETARIQENYLDAMITRFGSGFPGTKEFSDYARSTVLVDGIEDPDAALVAWMDQEESLYRTFERYLLSDRFSEADGDVDRVLELAMQTFQRRRSRAGHALENHTAHLLTLHGVRFERQAKTEGNKRPDFLFPGRTEYVDPSFPSDRLAMLGVKTTCKDRWRQVLTEADRIPIKHLLTLEAPISRNQTDEMAGRSLVPVVPRGLHGLFDPEQTSSLVSFGEFLTKVGPTRGCQ